MKYIGDEFLFNLDDFAIIKASNETGRVIARAECLNSENIYLIRYKSGVGVAVEQWWAESALIWPDEE